MSVSRYGSTLPKARMIEISDSQSATLDEQVKRLAQCVVEFLPLLGSDNRGDDGALTTISTTLFFDGRLSGRLDRKLWPISLNG